jgi:hypothetical protein
MKSKIRGIEIQIDRDEVWRLKEYNWCLNHRRGNKLYFIRHTTGRNSSDQLHREIMNCPKGMVCDHINGDTLDNRKSNLRICTSIENCRNSKRPKNNTSGYKGVHWEKANKKWVAIIQINYKKIYLGLFDDRQKAHEAYCKAAVNYHGEFANFG